MKMRNFGIFYLSCVAVAFLSLFVSWWQGRELANESQVHPAILKAEIEVAKEFAKEGHQRYELKQFEARIIEENRQVAQGLEPGDIVFYKSLGPICAGYKYQLWSVRSKATNGRFIIARLDYDQIILDPKSDEAMGRTHFWRAYKKGTDEWSSAAERLAGEEGLGDEFHSRYHYQEAIPERDYFTRTSK